MKNVCESCNGSGESSYRNKPCGDCSAKGFKHEFQSDVVCPFCGEIHNCLEVGVYGIASEEVDCNVCKKRFTAHGHVVQYFTSYELNQDKIKVNQ